MDVGQVMARLHAKGVNYMGVPGGVPELTVSDIAGALGFVPKGLGRAVLEAMYWPEGAERSGGLKEAVTALVVTELRKQKDRLRDAELELELAKVAVGWDRKPATPYQRHHLVRCQAKLEAVRALSWPKNTMERVPLIVKTILAELSGAVKCSVCAGTGEVQPGGKIEPCTECRGSGKENISERRRASLIECDHRDYTRRWKPVYEWLFKAVCDERVDAERSLTRVLSDNQLLLMESC